MGDKENLLINDFEEEIPPEEEKLAERKEEKVIITYLNREFLFLKTIFLFLFRKCKKG